MTTDATAIDERQPQVVRGDSPAPVVRAEGVSFSYPLTAGRRRGVLRGVDLSVDAGELVALLGTNGSGKTTLLRLLAGTLVPDGGELLLFGRPAGSWTRMGLARRIAVLPQSLELPSGFTVGELVSMGRLPHSRSLFGATRADEEAVDRALRDADARELASRHAEELSGGERQRVLVAMALAQEPQLLLLDEPTLHLDLAHQVGLLETIRRLRRERGIAVVAVLHDLALAGVAAPRVALLDEGRIVADGRPEEVLDPDLVHRVFGVAVEALRDGAGHARLVPLMQPQDLDSP
jgi:iron complex transport system ATP-binding protein